MCDALHYLLDNIYSASKLPVSKFRYFGNYVIQHFGYCYIHGFGQRHVMHVHFMFFAVFKNLKSSFSEDNMPGHALEIFIENATKMV